MNGKEITIQQNNGLLNAMSELVSKMPLDDVKTQFNAKTGTASITGHRNGIQYTTTLSVHPEGVIQTNAMFNKDMSREALEMQIKKLKKDGYKHTEIAEMLGISQPTVSNYLRR